MRINADPEELRRFSYHLRQAADLIHDYSSRLKNSISSTADSWTDQTGKGCLETLHEIAGWLDRFNDEVGDCTSFLLDKAQKLEQYNE